MRTNSKILSAIISMLLIFSFVSFFSACGGGGSTGPAGPSGANGKDGEDGIVSPSVPIIGGMAIYPQPIYTSATFVCAATDPQGDSLSYTWKVGGITVANNDWFIWNSPCIPGHYEAKVTVSDGNYTATGVEEVMVASGSLWPRFRRDIQSTGLGLFLTNTVAVGTMKWSYTTGNTIYSSPSIGSDGTVYIGSYDDKFYALNPDGTLKWSYATGDYLRSSPAIGFDGTERGGSYQTRWQGWLG